MGVRNVKLEGSCHCGAVRFSAESKAPMPFSRCYCTICRKTSGGGGYTINLLADARTLKIDGEEHITVYRSKENDRGAYEDDGLGFSRRHFCARCGSALWVHNPKWPDFLHPFASAIDTDLPKPPEIQSIMTAHAVNWVDLPVGPRFENYPEMGLEDWHRAHGVYLD